MTVPSPRPDRPTVRAAAAEDRANIRAFPLVHGAALLVLIVILILAGPSRAQQASEDGAGTGGAETAAEALAPPLSLRSGDEAMEVRRVQFDPRVDAGRIEIVMLPDAREAFAAFTAAHAGRNVSVRVCGEEAMQAVFGGPVATGVIRFPAKAEEETRRLLHRLENGCPIAS